MKNLALLLIACFVLSACGKPEVPATETDLRESFVKSISEIGRIDFESWNGKPRGVDSDSALHFYKDSRVVLEDRGIGITHYEGSYEVRPEGRVVVTLKTYHKDWPLMILRRDGADWLLYREDGHTSWLPKGDPNLPDPRVDGFWPFRASTIKIAQQDAPSDGEKPPK
jgi:hypothetical protein